MVVLGLGGVLLKPELFLIIHCFNGKGKGAYFVQVPIGVLDQNDQIRVFVTSRGHVGIPRGLEGLATVENVIYGSAPLAQSCSQSRASPVWLLGWS